MKNTLILHGAGNNSLGNWFPWLKQSLEKKGCKVWSPDLPNSNNPDQDEWTSFIFLNKEFEWNRNTVIIGHSAGGTLALRLLEKLPKKIKINKVILIAAYVEKGTIEKFYPYKVEMLKTPFNWGKIKNSCSNFYFICSDNDPYQCGQEQGEILQKNLGGELIVKKGQEHFNLEKSPSYKEFPEILQYIL